jgi:hypothetical protein
MDPSSEMFVTTDPNEGWQQAKSEATERPEKAQAPEVEPTRPEGSEVRSPGWEGRGDCVSEESAARKMDAWVNSAQQRNQDVHQRLEQSGHATPAAATDRSSLELALAAAAVASSGKDRSAHEDLRKSQGPTATKPDQTTARETHSAHDQLHENLSRPQTDATENAWERVTPNRGIDR